MKKTGLAIVTYGTNYGTYLQAFATQYMINKMGYETEVINMDSVMKDVSRSRKKYFISQLFNFSELRSYSRVILGIFYRKVNKKYDLYIQNRVNKCKEFRDKYFNFSEICDSWDGLTEYCEKEYDNVLVGSDQLWRPANIAGNFYTLNFVPDTINKISYATSFGLRTLRKNQKVPASKFLSRIQHLSTREVTGAQIIKDITSRNVPVVVDPTLVLDANDWLQFMEDEPIVKGKYILCYLLGDNPCHRNFIRRLAKEKNLKIVGILHVAGYIAGDDHLADIIPSDIGPFEFLNLIKNAEYVCTDSFHGCVFTIQFGRKLAAFKRFSDNDKMSTNDRITTLLHTVGMEKNLLSGNEDVVEYTKICNDYSSVASSLKKKRDDAYRYLTSAFAQENTDLNNDEGIRNDKY